MDYEWFTLSYVVKSGDTISKICNRFCHGLSVKIVRNGSSNFDINCIKPGDFLVITPVFIDMRVSSRRNNDRRIKS